jgi:hypothetical protein
MEVRSVVALAACAVLVMAGLTACGGSRVQVIPARHPPKAFQTLFHPHRFALNQVKAAFATQGIRLRTMPNPYGSHVVVLFDPRWHAPTGFHFDGGGYAHTYFWVFVHASAGFSSAAQDGNVYVANGQGEGRSVSAALHKLDLTYKH